MNRHVNAIAGRLSLRKPQCDSLEILDRITEIVPPNKAADLAAAMEIIRSEYQSAGNARGVSWPPKIRHEPEWLLRYPPRSHPENQTLARLKRNEKAAFVSEGRFPGSNWFTARLPARRRWVGFRRRCCAR